VGEEGASHLVYLSDMSTHGTSSLRYGSMVADQQVRPKVKKGCIILLATCIVGRDLSARFHFVEIEGASSTLSVG
jgi:hypothetical protein